MASFTGADGKTYELRLTARRLMRYEDRTGKKTLRQLFGSIGGAAHKSEEEVTDTLMQGVGEIFSSIGDAAALLYECCLTPAQQKEMPFDDPEAKNFCEDVLSGAALQSAATSIFTAITEQAGAKAAAAGVTGIADPKTAGK